MTSDLKLLTTGVYGSAEQEFFDALSRAGVDTFVDIRQRRGVRGSEYAFVNAKRLESRLGAMGIRYLHLKELAPTQAVRDVQRQADASLGTAKRDRAHLSPEFAKAYREACLTDYRVDDFAAAVGGAARVVCLFCVEGAPEACHRSIASEFLARGLGATVEHLRR